MKDRSRRRRYLSDLQDDMERRCLPIGGSDLLVSAVVTPLRLHRVRRLS